MKKYSDLIKASFNVNPTIYATILESTYSKNKEFQWWLAEQYQKDNNILKNNIPYISEQYVLNKPFLKPIIEYKNFNQLKNDIIKILCEGINEIQKYFPKIPLEKIKELVALDPTYKGGNELGKYGKWILSLYNKNNLKQEDFYKVTEYLTTFKNNLSKMKNKDINAYKTLPDLASAIKSFEGQEDISHKQELKNIKNNEAEKVFENNTWVVIVPKTEEASCLYGKNTKWCTAAKNNSFFDDYNDKGQLYILINKIDNHKYQFHFPTQSFMDELDRPIFLDEFFYNQPQALELKIFFAEEISKNIYNWKTFSDVIVNDEYLGVKYGSVAALFDIIYNLPYASDRDSKYIDYNDFDNFYILTYEFFEDYYNDADLYIPFYKTLLESINYYFNEELNNYIDLYSDDTFDDLIENKEFYSIITTKLNDTLYDKISNSLYPLIYKKFGISEFDTNFFVADIDENMYNAVMQGCLDHSLYSEYMEEIKNNILDEEDLALLEDTYTAFSNELIIFIKKLIKESIKEMFAKNQLSFDFMNKE